MTLRLRVVLRGLRARFAYRLDTLLSYPPLVQALALLVVTALVVVAWAVVVRLALPHDPALHDGREALWWSLTHFFDGGTMASDPARLRWIAVGSTATGVLVLSLLTAAFASKLGERLGDVRRGLSPVVERGHIVALGFDARIALVAREIAQSGQRCTLVVLSTEDKDRIEAALRPWARVHGSRLRTVVRTGDPRIDAALLRIGAPAACGAIVVPPATLDDAAAVRWTLSTLLAFRRVGEGTFRGHVLVEAWHADARDLLLLASEPGVAGESALSLEVIASDQLVARVLAQSVRQEGVYFALRQLLEFEGTEIYLDPVPDALVGLAFDAAHASLQGALLTGVRRADGTTVLCPHRSDDVVLARGDRLIVLARGHGQWRLGGRLPTRPTASMHPSTPPTDENQRPRRIIVLGFNRTLPHLAREFDGMMPPGSRMRIVCGSAGASVTQFVSSMTPALTRLAIECDLRDPDTLAREGDDALYEADAVVILGCEDERDESGDARALATLLWLRHGARQKGRTPRRVVTEVRDPRSAAHVARFAHDFVVSTDVVAMLLAQVALDPAIGPVWREVLSPDGTEVFVRSRARYVSPGAGATFADVMASAREHGEIALGFYAHPSPTRDAKPRPDLDDLVDDAPALPTWLNPPRTTPVPDDPCVQIIVLGRPPRVADGEAEAERSRADRAAAAMG